MNLERLCEMLRLAQAKVIFITHDEDLSSAQQIDLRRFADHLRGKGFITLIAEDYRSHGMKRVDNAIDVADLTMVVAFNEATARKARDRGVPFIEIEGKGS